jgi:hypothetical protein
MTATRHSILEVVELLVDSGRWPAGTIGTIVEISAEAALVEISDDRGHALDFISLPQSTLVSRPRQPTERAAS